MNRRGDVKSNQWSRMVNYRSGYTTAVDLVGSTTLQKFDDWKEQTDKQMLIVAAPPNKKLKTDNARPFPELMPQQQYQSFARQIASVPMVNAANMTIIPQAQRERPQLLLPQQPLLSQPTKPRPTFLPALSKPVSALVTIDPIHSHPLVEREQITEYKGKRLDVNDKLATTANSRVIEWFDTFKCAHMTDIYGNAATFNQLRTHLRLLMLESFHRPRLIILSGATGLGKSTGAKLILSEIGIKVEEFDPFFEKSMAESASALKAKFYSKLLELQWSDRASNVDVWKDESKATTLPEKKYRRVIFVDHADVEEAKPITQLLEAIIAGSKPVIGEKKKKNESKKLGAKHTGAALEMIGHGNTKNKNKKHWIPSVVICVVNDPKASPPLQHFFDIAMGKGKKKKKQQPNPKKNDDDKGKNPTLSIQAQKAMERHAIESRQDELEERTPRIALYRFWPIYGNEMHAFGQRMINDSNLKSVVPASVNLLGAPLQHWIQLVGGDVIAMITCLRSCAYGFASRNNEMDEFFDAFELASRVMRLARKKDPRSMQERRALLRMICEQEGQDTCNNVISILRGNLVTFWPTVSAELRAQHAFEINNVMRFKRIVANPAFAKVSTADQTVLLLENLNDFRKYTPGPTPLPVVARNDPQFQRHIYDCKFAGQKDRLKSRVAADIPALDDFADILAMHSELDTVSALTYSHTGGNDTEYTFEALSEQSYNLLLGHMLKQTVGTAHNPQLLIGKSTTHFKLDVMTQATLNREMNTGREFWENARNTSGASYWDEFDSSRPADQQCLPADAPYKQDYKLGSIAPEIRPKRPVPEIVAQPRILSMFEFRDQMAFFDRTMMAPDMNSYRKLAAQEKALEQARIKTKKQEEKQAKKQAKKATKDSAALLPKKIAVKKKKAAPRKRKVGMSDAAAAEAFFRKRPKA